MLQYFLETIAFQLAFLGVYDLFLKRETFFQWNRAYLLGSFVLSLVLPFIKIEAFKTVVPVETAFYPQFLQPLEPLVLGPAAEPKWWQWITPEQWILLSGSSLMLLWFAFKLYRIYQLRRNGQVSYHRGYTKILVYKSQAAFSFFKQVFLGDAIAKQKEPGILAHELVHIRQWHTLDLLFFEGMRIGLWFNPMVYLYQSRMAELHEFIADSKVAKNNRRAQYELLLSEVFQTQQLSFVNQFFKRSLIKKRIVMLSKQKSNAVFQFKYLLLLPLVVGMLVYTSCETQSELDNNAVEVQSLQAKLEAINLELAARDSLNSAEMEELLKMTEKMVKQMNSVPKTTDGRTVKAGINLADVDKGVPFAVVDQVPLFPGCEGAADTKACFTEKIHAHIRKHFNYPKMAQDQGIQGRVAVLFTIDMDGSITNIKKRGPHELLENEVERIIKRLPKMEPGRHKGQLVKVPFSVPITFKLNTGDIGSVESKKVAKSMFSVVKNTKIGDFIPSNIEFDDKRISETIKKYNQLAAERKRLLQATNPKNPIIINLDNQLMVLKIKVQEELQIIIG